MFWKYSKFVYFQSPLNWRTPGIVKAQDNPQVPDGYASFTQDFLDKGRERYDADAIIKSTRSEVKAFYKKTFGESYANTIVDGSLVPEEEKRLDKKFGEPKGILSGVKNLLFHRGKSSYKNNKLTARASIEMKGHLSLGKIWEAFEDKEYLELQREMTEITEYEKSTEAAADTEAVKTARETRKAELKEAMKGKTEVLDELREYLGSEKLDTAAYNPRLVFALAFLTKMKNPKDFLGKALGPKKLPGLDAEQKTKAFKDLNESKTTMKEGQEAIEKDGTSTFLDQLDNAKKELVGGKKKKDAAGVETSEIDIGAKAEYEHLSKNPPGSTEAEKAAGKTANAAAYTASLAAAEKRYQKAEAEYKKLSDEYKKVTQSLKILHRKLKSLVPVTDKHRKDVDTLVKKFDLYEDFEKEMIFGKGTTPDEKKLYGDKTRFEVVMEAISADDQFDGLLHSLMKHIKHDVEKGSSKDDKKEGTEGESEHKEHTSPYHTPEELLYKLFLQYRKTPKSEGGALADGKILNTEEKRELREESALWTQLSMMQTEHLKNTETAANILRNERAYKAMEGKSLLGKIRYKLWSPYKKMPRLDTIFKRLRVIELTEKDKDDKEIKVHPFANLKLKGRMKMFDIQREIDEERLKVEHIPKLIAYLNAFIDNGTHYRAHPDDLGDIVDLIGNLRLIKVYARHKKLTAEIGKKPEELDKKLLELWKDDLATEEKMEGDAKKKLVKFLTDYKTTESYKTESKRHVAHAREQYMKGEWTAAEAKNYLKESGVKKRIFGTKLWLAKKRAASRDWLHEKMGETPWEKKTGKKRGLAMRMGYQSTRPLRWMGSKTWAGTKIAGEKTWAGTKIAGEKVWDGTKWTGRNLIKRPVKAVGQGAWWLATDLPVLTGKKIGQGLGWSGEKLRQGGEKLKKGGTMLAAIPVAVAKGIANEAKKLGGSLAASVKNLPTAVKNAPAKIKEALKKQGGHGDHGGGHGAGHP